MGKGSSDNEKGSLQNNRGKDTTSGPPEREDAQSRQKQHVPPVTRRPQKEQGPANHHELPSAAESLRSSSSKSQKKRTAKSPPNNPSNSERSSGLDRATRAFATLAEAASSLPHHQAEAAAPCISSYVPNAGKVVSGHPNSKIRVAAAAATAEEVVSPELQAKRDYNRKCAARYRDKRRRTMTDMQSKVDAAKRENEELKAGNGRILDELSAILKTSNHADIARVAQELSVTLNRNKQGIDDDVETAYDTQAIVNQQQVFSAQVHALVQLVEQRAFETSLNQKPAAAVAPVAPPSPREQQEQRQLPSVPQHQQSAVASFATMPPPYQLQQPIPSAAAAPSQSRQREALQLAAMIRLLENQKQQQKNQSAAAPNPSQAAAPRPSLQQQQVLELLALNALRQHQQQQQSTTNIGIQQQQQQQQQQNAIALAELLLRQLFGGASSSRK